MAMLRREEKYIWTQHSQMKMRQYRLSESRIKRVIRHPARIEEGIIPGAIACMQPAGGKRYSEIWVLYILRNKKIKMVSCWRYPGRAPERDPVPPEILGEVRSIL